MTNMAELVSIAFPGRCSYELSDGSRLLCNIINCEPPKDITEDDLSKIIDWKDHVDLLIDYTWYRCEPPPSSICQFRELIMNNDESVHDVFDLEFRQSSILERIFVGFLEFIEWTLLN